MGQGPEAAGRSSCRACWISDSMERHRDKGMRTGRVRMGRAERTRRRPTERPKKVDKERIRLWRGIQRWKVARRGVERRREGRRYHYDKGGSLIQMILRNYGKTNAHLA